MSTKAEMDEPEWQGSTAKEEGKGTALILIDVINAFDFPESALAQRARASRVPGVYVNDNFGRWRSDFRQTVEGCMQDDAPGRNVTRQLQPNDGDYFVLKPMHSSFYCTPLELMLRHLGVTRLVLCGFATDLCVLFTAHDAHMRRFELVVPADCTAANSPEIAARALAHLREALGCSTEPSVNVEF